MATNHQPRIIAADRLHEKLIITFDDGRCGEFSSALLYSMLTEANELFEQDDVSPGQIEHALFNPDKGDQVDTKSLPH